MLNEAYKISKSNDLKGNPIAYIDPNAPENQNTFEYKTVFKDSGAEWSQSFKYKNVFPQNTKGFWFWYIGKSEEQWRNAFEKRIKPALAKIHDMQGVPSDESKESLLASLQTVIEGVKNSNISTDADLGDVQIDKKKILNKLEEFKLRIINMKDDEEFKATLKKILEFRSAQGHQFSLANTFLVFIQNPDATLVKSRSNWLRYNRNIINNPSPIYLWKPGKMGLIPYSKEVRDGIINSFLKSVGKRDVSQLTPQESERLAPKLSGRFNGRDFELYDAYDITDTVLMEGKEDLIAPSLADKDIEWADTNIQDEKVKPIYDALYEFAASESIKITTLSADELGGAHGSSSGGEINLIDNDGTNVGLTKTLAHEIAHEMLHQNYLKDRNQEMRDYFVGQAEGRGVVEQQAELCAWMVLAAFGFDLKTTSFNYIALWGGNPENMIKVFDNVSKTANRLISEVMKKGIDLTEDVTGKKQYTAMDVASLLGVESQFKQVLANNGGGMDNSLIENFKRLIGNR
jgi:hypothetical protein